MKTIIGGSRTITDYETFKLSMLEVPWQITHIVSGGARGVDTLAERYAKEHSIPLTVLRADWATEGRAAGYKRNVRMAEEPGVEALAALWDGKSRGTYHMIDIAGRKNLKIHVIRIDGVNRDGSRRLQGI